LDAVYKALTAGKVIATREIQSLAVTFVEKSIQATDGRRPAIL